jgi:type IV secretion system protein VirD4
MRDEEGLLAATHGDSAAYPLLRRFGNMMSNWIDRELSSILSSVSEHVSWLNSPLIESHLSASTFDPRELVRGKLSAYLVLPPKFLTTHSRLLRLWFTTLYSAVTECGEQDEGKVLFMLDEAGNLGPLPTLYQAITLGRSFGVKCWLMTQSLGQLGVLFPNEAHRYAVDASIDTKIFFGIRDYKTAEELSLSLGQATVRVTSNTQSEGETNGGSLLTMLAGSQSYSRSTNTGSSSTTSETGRRLLRAEEVLCQPGHIAIILTKNVRPIRAQLAPYYCTPELAKLMPEVNKPISPAEVRS